jgi:spermidine synthase
MPEPPTPLTENGPASRPGTLRRRYGRLFLAAYTCSGASGLIYQVNWTRWLTLHMGHSTAATSTVVAAVMGGLAVGAVAGGRFATGLSRRQAIYAYCILEAVIAGTALMVPHALSLMLPLLAWSYGDGVSGTWFPTVRLVTSLGVIAVPAMALGGTFPVASRLYVGPSDSPGWAAGKLYAVNAAGAGVGALAAGFFLIPMLGVGKTMLVAVAIAAIGITCALGLASRSDAELTNLDGSKPVRKPKPRRTRSADEPVASVRLAWLAAGAAGVAGFAGMTYEIVWTRLLSMTVGPTTYAFSATLAALIAGIALGSGLGSWGVKRTGRPVFWLAVTLTATAIAASVASVFGGTEVPKTIALAVASSGGDFNRLLPQHTAMAAALIVPLAIGLGAAFPFAIEIAAGKAVLLERRLGNLYAINTLSGVAGALVTGFIAVPRVGLEPTLQAANGLVIAAGVALGGWGGLRRRDQVISLLFSVIALTLLIGAPRWDRKLLASGVYKYPAYLEKGFDLDVALRAGELLYYREGAAGTVSVKRLAGSTALAIDGKVDASNSRDMLTQKALAHIPLLLHPNPRDVFIVGLGSGVTVASALVHPISRADIAEISPEVVVASRFFSAENRNALGDPRAHLIVGDGRTHLQLAARTYDVIISEPSNPWMTGVASLFTHEFFEAARSRLAPGGILCQWAHTYDISDENLRSIVATALSVFPHITVWFVGSGDVLLVASEEPLEPLLENVGRAWRRPGVEADLRKTLAMDPFAILSLFGGGSEDLKRYGAGATIQTDDRTALEFTGPLAVSSSSDVDNAANLRSAIDPRLAPAIVKRARADAGATQWRDRAAMLASAEDYPGAYEDYARAVRMAPADSTGLDGLVRASVAVSREPEALQLLGSLAAERPAPAIPIAMSKLLAASGAFDEAIATMRKALATSPDDPRALEQLASIYSDVGALQELDQVVAALRRVEPDGRAGRYYGAVAALGKGRFADAVSLVEQAISVDATDPAAHNLLGAAQASLGRATEARQAFHEALRLNPREAATYVNLGLLELQRQNAVEASALFAEALSLDPASEAAREGLVQASGRR